MVPQIRMDATTRRISFKTPQSVKTREEVLPIYKMLALDLRLTARDLSYQEDHRDVQSKGNTGIE